MVGRQQNHELDRAPVGGREKREILIVDYDADWPAHFDAQRARVRQALGPGAIRIEHIGSTAVPGLAAKPIIDLLVTVENSDDPATVERLTAAGYGLRVREPGHQMLRSPPRDVHLHVWGDADPEVGLYLLFRDRLCCSAEDRRAYDGLKRDLAARKWRDMNEYADAKGPLIEAILRRARR